MTMWNNQNIPPKIDENMGTKTTHEFQMLKAQVDYNKEEIAVMKNNVDRLENQIWEISTKMDKFKLDTDKIIEGITRRIQESELKYEENISPNKSNTLSWDVTMNKVKTSVQNTFEHFSLTWREDFTTLKEAVKAEVSQFREFLKYKKKELMYDLKDNLDSILPNDKRK